MTGVNQVWIKRRRVMRWRKPLAIAIDLEERERAAIETTLREHGWTRATGATPATRRRLTVRAIDTPG
jgi:hypothetical protein